MYLVGLDVGTTGSKSVIFDEKGSIVGSHYEEYPLRQRKPGWSELDSHEVWRTIIKVMSESVKQAKIEASDSAALGVSALGTSTLPLDEKNEPLYPCIQANDTRGREQLETISEAVDTQDMEKRGLILYIFAGLPYVKIMWLRDNEPEVYRRANRMVNIEGYVYGKLCGEVVTDYSIASAYGIFNQLNRRWDSEAIDTVDIEGSLLPEALPSSTPLGEIDGEIAEKTSLPKDTQIFTGGHDLSCSSLGVGAVEENLLADITGTYEFICSCLPQSYISKREHIKNFYVECHVVKDRYQVLRGAYSGCVLRWYRDNFAFREVEEARRTGRSAYDILTERASKAEIGSKQLLMTPDFTRGGIHGLFKIPDNLRGSFLGLTMEHGPGEIVRSIMEATAFEVRLAMEAFKELGLDPRELRATGGGAKSEVWMQMKSNATRTRVVAPVINEGGCVGAAILAGVGAKVYRDEYDGVKKMFSSKASYDPDEKLSVQYDPYYNLYKELRKNLLPIYDKLTAIQK